MKKERQRAILSVLGFDMLFFSVLAAFWLVVELYTRVWERVLSGMPVLYCVLHDLWHVYCPFCGATRAFWALASFDILASLKANPLVLLLLAWLALFNILWAVKCRKPKFLVPSPFWTVLGLSLFAVARNIMMIFFNIDTLGELAAFWR